MKRNVALCLLVLLPFAISAVAQCGGCYFYGGDFDPNNPNANALANETDAIIGGEPYGAATYQNFVLTNGGGWGPLGFFTNDLSSLNPTSVYWELRAGVSEGNGGTLLLSGTATGNAFINTPTGRSGFGYTEYTYGVTDLDTFLPDGVYWFAVVPNDPNSNGRSFNSNTFGLNSVGTEISNEQYFNSAFFGADFTNANNEGVYPTFSSGAYAWIPEPSSLIMFGCGLVAAAGVVRRRLSR